MGLKQSQFSKEMGFLFFALCFAISALRRATFDKDTLCFMSFVAKENIKKARRDRKPERGIKNERSI